MRRNIITIMKILRELNKEKLLISNNINKTSAEILIEDVEYNSKLVKPNCVFVCKGINFKEEYLIEAIKNGAKLYISETQYDVNLNCIIVNDTRKALAVISKLFYGEEIDKIIKIGITGTKGKSTVATYLKDILDEYLNTTPIEQCAISSSINTYDGKERKTSYQTTPESLDLYKLIKSSYDNDAKYFVNEVSSISYKYYRTYGITYDIGMFLNIGYDHISSIEHHSFEDYFNCKLDLLKNSKKIIINKNLLKYKEVKELIKSKDSKDVFVVSLNDKISHFYARDIKVYNDKTNFCVTYKNYNYKYSLTMKGLYNIENAIFAIAAATFLEIPYKYIYAGLKKSKVNGRLEIYESKNKEKIAIVDYAHNELSFNNYFKFVENEYKDRYHICIIGAPGGKAFNRRKEIGTICPKHCDELIITSDDPGSESFEEICNSIIKYIPKEKEVNIIEDRMLAIKYALNNSHNNTVISILGKGNEKCQKYGSEQVSYLSDSVVAKKYLDI